MQPGHLLLLAKMSKFEAAVRTQMELHHRIRRIVANLKKLGKEKITPISITTRLEALEASWKSFVTTHSGLISSQTKELKDHVYFENDYYSLCEAAYFESKDELVALRQSLDDAEDLPVNCSHNSTVITTSRNGISRALPKITLPKFNGDYSSWPSFRDLFTSIITSNSEVPPVEKLHYLKSHVTGEAAQRIASFTITANNFELAWKSLTARYENKRVLIRSNFDKLFELQPLTQKSAQIFGSLQALGAPVDQWDWFAVYFVAGRLDPASREAWELEQSGETEPPSFAELEKFLDARTRALEVITPQAAETSASSNKSRVKTKASARVNAASTANPLNFKCSQCHENHYISRCPVFISKPVAERRKIVHSLRLCFNCLDTHKLSECRTIKRCRLCNS